VAAMRLDPCQAGHQSFLLNTRSNAKGSLHEGIALIGSWMSSYFSATNDLNMLDFRYVERNRKVVGNYCKTHKSDTVMSAKQKNWR
jgi:hypothetical protein